MSTETIGGAAVTLSVQGFPAFHAAMSKAQQVTATLPQAFSSSGQSSAAFAHNLQQLSFVSQDLITSTGFVGLRSALSGRSNDFSRLAFTVLPPVAAAFAALGATIGIDLLPKFLSATFGAKDLANEFKNLNAVAADTLRTFENVQKVQAAGYEAKRAVATGNPRQTMEQARLLSFQRGRNKPNCR